MMCVVRLRYFEMNAAGLISQLKKPDALASECGVSMVVAPAKSSYNNVEGLPAY